MRRILTLSLASTALLLVLGNLAAAQQIKRAEKLLGGNENPPVVTDATGNFRARLFADRIEYRLRYDVADSDVTQAHLHVANPGNNGNIAAFLCSNADGATAPECPPSPGVVEGEIVAADVLEVIDVAEPVTILEAEDLDGLARLIRQGSVYANVHSVDHPAGEIRGQLSPRIR